MAVSVRKLLLAVHLTCSVGWIGSVIAYVVLDFTVASSTDDVLVRSAWVGMGLVASSVILPLAIASLVTGIAIAAGTRWGLFRHWWVLISLVLTIAAVVVLQMETGVIVRSAAIAADPQTSTERLMALPNTLLHSLGGLLVLLVIQLLNVYKPQGLTPYGWRKQQSERATRGP